MILVCARIRRNLFSESSLHSFVNGNQTTRPKNFEKVLRQLCSLVQNCPSTIGNTVRENTLGMQLANLFWECNWRTYFGNAIWERLMGLQIVKYFGNAIRERILQTHFWERILRMLFGNVFREHKLGTRSTFSLSCN